MINFNFYRTRNSKATDTFLAHLLLDEAVRIYEKVHYQQQRINAENAIDYVRLRHRVSCCPFLRF